MQRSTPQDFRTIILDIIGVTPDSKMNHHTLKGSKMVQELGFTNKKGKRSVGISSSLTISKAIGEYFEDNEVIIDGDHVLGETVGIKHRSRVENSLDP